MASVTRIENLSGADQELAPGSGFIPAQGFRDYPSDEYSEKHEKYAKARLEADPPILKVGEASGDAEAGDKNAGAGQQTLPEGVPQPATTSTPAQKQTDQNASDARQQEEQKRLAEREAQQHATQASHEETRKRR